VHRGNKGAAARMSELVLRRSHLAPNHISVLSTLVGIQCCLAAIKENSAWELTWGRLETQKAPKIQQSWKCEKLTKDKVFRLCILNLNFFSNKMLKNFTPYLFNSIYLFCLFYMQIYTSCRQIKIQQQKLLPGKKHDNIVTCDNLHWISFG